MDLTIHTCMIGMRADSFANTFSYLVASAGVSGAASNIDAKISTRSSTGVPRSCQRCVSSSRMARFFACKAGVSTKSAGWSTLRPCVLPTKLTYTAWLDRPKLTLLTFSRKISFSLVSITAAEVPVADRMFDSSSSKRVISLHTTSTN